MQVHSVGIDLDKTTFHLVALGGHEKVFSLHFRQSAIACLIGSASSLTARF